MWGGAVRPSKGTPDGARSEEGQVTKQLPQVTCRHRPLVPEGNLRSLGLAVPKCWRVIWLCPNKFRFVAPFQTPPQLKVSGVGRGVASLQVLMFRVVGDH